MQLYALSRCGAVWNELDSNSEIRKFDMFNGDIRKFRHKEAWSSNKRAIWAQVEAKIEAKMSAFESSEKIFLNT